MFTVCFYVYAVDIVSSCNVEWPAFCITWHMSQIDSWLSIKHLLNYYYRGGKDCLQQYKACGKTCRLADKVGGGRRGIRYSISRWWWCFLYHQRDGPHKPDENVYVMMFGELALTDEDKMMACVEHYVRLLNVWVPKCLPPPPPPPPIQNGIKTEWFSINTCQTVLLVWNWYLSIYSRSHVGHCPGTRSRSLQ